MHGIVLARDCGHYCTGLLRSHVEEDVVYIYVTSPGPVLLS